MTDSSSLLGIGYSTPLKKKSIFILSLTHSGYMWVSVAALGLSSVLCSIRPGLYSMSTAIIVPAFNQHFTAGHWIEMLGWGGENGPTLTSWANSVKWPGLTQKSSSFPEWTEGGDEPLQGRDGPPGCWGHHLPSTTTTPLRWKRKPISVHQHHLCLLLRLLVGVWF